MNMQMPMDAARQAAGDPDDEKLFVQFYMGSLQNEEKTADAGHPVFDSVPFIKIIIPGDRNSNIDTIAGPQYQRRFARLWAQFQANEAQSQPGLPLREWPGITRAQAEELQYLNITTVEQLATLADVYGTRVMGFNDLKRKAAAYLEQAKDSAYAQRVAEENKKLLDMISQLQGEIKTLSARFDASDKAGTNDQPKQQSPGRR